MTTLLALIFMPVLETIIAPSYKIESCYSISEPEFRPGTIQITDVKNSNYEYKVWLENSKWSLSFENDIDTIERVYERNVQCPNTII